MFKKISLNIGFMFKYKYSEKKLALLTNLIFWFQTSIIEIKYIEIKNKKKTAELE